MLSPLCIALTVDIWLASALSLGAVTAWPERCFRCSVCLSLLYRTAHCVRCLDHAVDWLARPRWLASRAACRSCVRPCACVCLLAAVCLPACAARWLAGRPSPRLALAALSARRSRADTAALQGSKAPSAWPEGQRTINTTLGSTLTPADRHGSVQASTAAAPPTRDIVRHCAAQGVQFGLWHAKMDSCCCWLLPLLVYRICQHSLL